MTFHDGVLLSDDGIAAWERDHPRHRDALRRAEEEHPHLRRTMAALLQHRADYAGSESA